MRMNTTGRLFAAAATLSAVFVLPVFPAAAGEILPTPSNILPLVPLIASPSALSITKGDSTQVTYTFTNLQTTGIWITHINAFTAPEPATRRSDCLQNYNLSDPTARLLNTGQSYSFVIPVVVACDVGAGTRTSTVGNSTIKAAIWWEYNLPHRGHLIYKQSTTVNIAAH